MSNSDGFPQQQDRLHCRCRCRSPLSAGCAGDPPQSRMSSCWRRPQFWLDRPPGSPRRRQATLSRQPRNQRRLGKPPLPPRQPPPLPRTRAGSRTRRQTGHVRPLLPQNPVKPQPPLRHRHVQRSLQGPKTLRQAGRKEPLWPQSRAERTQSTAPKPSLATPP